MISERIIGKFENIIDVFNIDQIINYYVTKDFVCTLIISGAHKAKESATPI